MEVNSYFLQNDYLQIAKNLTIFEVNNKNIFGTSLLPPNEVPCRKWEYCNIAGPAKTI